MCVEDRLNIFYKHEKEERVSGSQREASPNELVKDVRTATILQGGGVGMSEEDPKETKIVIKSAHTRPIHLLAFLGLIE